jgi:hypothetical protein
MTQETVTESPDEQVDAQAPVAENGNTEEAEETTPTLSPEAEQIQKLEAELAAANQKVAELTDIVQRTAAEFQNSRRRQERQLQDEIERASSHLLNRMLPVLDDLSLAFGNLPSELASGRSRKNSPVSWKMRVWSLWRLMGNLTPIAMKLLPANRMRLCPVVTSLRHCALVMNTKGEFCVQPWYELLCSIV